MVAVLLSNTYICIEVARGICHPARGSGHIYQVNSDCLCYNQVLFHKRNRIGRSPLYLNRIQSIRLLRSIAVVFE